MKTIALIIAAILGSIVAPAQGKYFSRTANVSFFSSTPVEDIDAHNRTATFVIDSESGAVECSALMKSFEFKKALMQEHFNENYVESNKYPKAEFKGKVLNIGDVNFTKDGEYPVKIKGTLKLHGESKEIESDGTVTVKGDDIKSSTEFVVSPADFNIEIPSVVRENIAKEITVKFNSPLKPLKR